jgi:hypothetical protein
MSVIVDARITDHLAIAASYATRPDDWPVVPRFNIRRRWYYRLAEAPDHEVWLLTWLPGQDTELHDHGGSAGAMLVVSGVLTEETPAPGGLGLRQRMLPAGAGHRFGPHHIHRVANHGDQPVVSLHVYGPALRTMTRYRIGADGLEAVGVERAGAQW